MSRTARRKLVKSSVCAARGISGVQTTAYTAVFGKEASPLFSNQALKTLEVKRHLIVHSGGIVDDEYIRRTGDEILIGGKLSSQVRAFRPWRIAP
jgi:hypothetical protein